jgi:hypothetical protein
MDKTQITQAAGDWLNQYSWDWFVTLTFENPVTRTEAFKRFNRWKVQLKKAAGSRIEYVMVIEDHKYRGSIPHLHILLSGAEQENPRKWQQEWYRTNGLCKVEIYNPHRGASYYLGGKLADGNAEVKFSKGLKPIR